MSECTPAENCAGAPLPPFLVCPPQLACLQERGIDLHEVEGGVAEVQPTLLQLSDGSQLPFDECLWCTQAGAAGWVADSGLPTDEGEAPGSRLSAQL